MKQCDVNSNWLRTKSNHNIKRNMVLINTVFKLAWLLQ